MNFKKKNLSGYRSLTISKFFSNVGLMTFRIHSKTLGPFKLKYKN